MMEQEPAFVNADYVKKLVGVSATTAYKIIRDVNADMVAAGYYLPKRGLVNRAWLLERLGLASDPAAGKVAGK